MREPYEFEAGRIHDSLHVPLAELPNALAHLDPDIPVVCVCRSGQRSEYATAWLRAQGIDAANMTGGMLAWAAEGLPFEGPDGGAGQVV